MGFDTGWFEWDEDRQIFAYCWPTRSAVSIAREGLALPFDLDAIPVYVPRRSWFARLRQFFAQRFAGES